jgi:hypothetical protein
VTLAATRQIARKEFDKAFVMNLFCDIALRSSLDALPHNFVESLL